MFRKAHLQLTLVYSALFLLLFWLFSFGLYFWMDNSFGEAYISQVKQQQTTSVDPAFNAKNNSIVTIAGDVAVDQLRTTLFTLNGILVFIIPFISWFLAKRTLSPIQKMHEQQKQFVTDASHELRTPLSIMSGEIEVMLLKKRTIEEYITTLQSTKEETYRLSQLSESLLFLAQEDNHNSSALYERVDITDVLDTVVQSLKPKSEEKHIVVKLVSNNSLNPTILAHTVLLRQLFYNLLDNALTYTPGKGKVTITLAETKKILSIAIKDTGIGIPEQEQKKIFDRFYRVDPSRSQTKGYGLGLSIVQAIIKRHHGHIYVHSQVNKGTIFYIELPKP